MHQKDSLSLEQYPDKSKSALRIKGMNKKKQQIKPGAF